jgi:hypothetical protein
MPEINSDKVCSDKVCEEGLTKLDLSCEGFEMGRL